MRRLASTIRNLLKPKMELPTFSHRLSELMMVDIGSGDGKLALEIAKLIKAKEVILVDRENRLEVSLPPNTKFFQIDIYSKEFLYSLPDADVMTCLRTFHEFPHPFPAAMRLILKTSGILIVQDWMEKGWERILREDRKIKDEEKRKKELAHDEEDIRLVRRNRLYTQEEISRFWKAIDLNTPGLLEFHWERETYVIIYCAWIEREKINSNQINVFNYYGPKP